MKCLQRFSFIQVSKHICDKGEVKRDLQGRKMYGLCTCFWFQRIQEESSYKIHLNVKEGESGQKKICRDRRGGGEFTLNCPLHHIKSNAAEEGKDAEKVGGRKKARRQIFIWNCTKHVSTHEHTHSHTQCMKFCVTDIISRIWYLIENSICNTPEKNSHSTNENTVDFLCVIYVCKQPHKLTLRHTDLFE